MHEDLTQFEAMVARLHGGDPSAAEEIVRHYEPFVRRAVRMSLQHSSLRRTLDSMDLCQSVFAAFFYQVATGATEVVGPDHLVKLLTTIARRKLAQAMRKDYRRRRQLQAVMPPAGSFSLIDPAPTPSKILSSKDLAHRIRALLSDEERELAGMRSSGASWAKIAERTGGSALSCRVQLFRAIRRVLGELGMSEDGI
ncbi:sigma-70 family RNA polymerase sigma factor [bacterium]|nr:sigma-70 family RNA polymerase sigma factor [bacterium]